VQTIRCPHCNTKLLESHPDSDLPLAFYECRECGCWFGYKQGLVLAKHGLACRSKEVGPVVAFEGCLRQRNLYSLMHPVLRLELLSTTSLGPTFAAGRSMPKYFVVGPADELATKVRTLGLGLVLLRVIETSSL